jgi:2-haloacid dehalogenase
MNYPYILLDADDTLLDFDRSETCALRDTLARCGLPSDDGLLARYKEINKDWWRAFERGETTKPALVVARWADFLRACGSGANPAAANAFYMERLGSYSFTLPGAEALCAELARRGHVLALVTNGTADVQRRRWSASPAAKYVPQVFISEEMGSQKPEKRFFDQVLAALGGPDRGRCLVVGDSETSDMRGGKNAGIPTCWYNPAGRAAAEPWDHEIRTLAALLTVV